MHGKTNAVFITGTDTDAGKTVFCAQLLVFLRRKGINAISQKWVQTGCNQSDDAAFHASVAGTPPTQTPLRFTYPAAPHLAARLEGKSVDVGVISTALGELMLRHDIVLCEGSGGVLSPLADDLLISDFVAKLAQPAIIVCANKLGCINHALMTVECLKSRGIDILGLAFTRVSPDTDEIIARDNIETVRAFSGETMLGEIKWLEQPNEYNADFESIGECFLEQWSKYSGRTD